MRRFPLVLLLMCISACSGEPGTEEVSTETVSAETVSTSTGPEAVEGEREVMVTEEQGLSLLASATLRDGDTVEPERVSAGTDLRLDIRVREVPEGLAAWVHWVNPEGTVVAREQKDVPPDGNVSFSASTTGWPDGQYQGEIYIGGDLVDTRSIAIGAGGGTSE